MKKILIVATLAASLSGLTASAQGYFNFSGNTRGVWDQFSTSANATAPKLAATFDVGFLYGSGAPLIAGILASTPTNTAATFNNAAAWNAILNDPNFHLAIDNNTGTGAF